MDSVKSKFWDLGGEHVKTIFTFNLLLCLVSEKRQKIEDIKKNIRDAILVMINLFRLVIFNLSSLHSDFISLTHFTLYRLLVVQ